MGVAKAWHGRGQPESRRGVGGARPGAGEEWAGRAGSGRGQARVGAEGGRGGSHVAHAHMTGGAMDPLPAAAVPAAAEVEADEEADLPAAGEAVGRAGWRRTWARDPGDPAALGSLTSRPPRRVGSPTPRGARGSGLSVCGRGSWDPSTCPGLRLAAHSCPRLPGAVPTLGQRSARPTLSAVPPARPRGLSAWTRGASAVTGGAGLVRPPV